MIELTKKYVNPYTPPLGHHALTPLYDFVIKMMTREMVWRSAFINQINPQPGDRIVDIGAGTGSLAMALHRVAPEIRYIGVDPDANAVKRAVKKAEAISTSIKFAIEFFDGRKCYLDRKPDKIISSLVLHQVPIDEKKRIIDHAYSALTEGGSIHIADYGRQNTKLLRLLYRLTVQAFDGVKNTQPNAEGVVVDLLKEAGFEDVTETRTIPTLTGSISIYSARKQNGPL